MLFLKKSFTEHPARPDDAQAHAQAHDDAQAQDEAQDETHAQDERCDPPPERVPPDRVPPPDRGRLTGILTTLTRMYVFGESP